MSWAKIKRNQANDADSLAAVASGIGEYGITNACYRRAGILKEQARLYAEAEERLTASQKGDSVSLDVTDQPKGT